MKIQEPLLAVVLLAGCTGGPEPDSIVPQDSSLQKHTLSSNSLRGFTCPVTDYWDVFMGAPISFNTNNHHAICYKYAGSLPDCSPGQNPDFARIPGDWLPAGDAFTVSPVLAMSLGIDVINVQRKDLVSGDKLDGNPVTGSLPVAAVDFTAPGHGWMALLFTVNEPVGTGSEPLALAVEHAQFCHELERTVFQYAVPGSSMGATDQVLRALSPDDLALGTGDKIQAMNLHMTFFHAGIAPPPSPPAPDQWFSRPRPDPTDTKIYFTFHPGVLEEIDANHNDWEWPPIESSDLSSATIFVSQWTGTKWTKPAVFMTWKDFNNPTTDQNRLSQNDAIDGLAIDIRPGVTGILFSTEDADIEDQLLYHSTTDKMTVQFVVEDPPGSGEYGTGGRRLRSRKGVGDFCVADPWMLPREKRPRNTPDSNGDPVPDDYVVARPLNPALIPDAMQGTTRLVVSGFRQEIDDRLFMRTTMAMNKPPQLPLAARVRFGRTQYSAGPQGEATIGSITWIEELGPFASDGKPMTKQYPIEIPLKTFFGDRAFVAQWSITMGNQVFVSPVCVLRL